MDRQVNGVVSGHESCSAISTHASNAVAKAQPSITLFPVLLVVEMMSGIFSVCAQHAIIRREGGFLVHLLHP
jgi:hypothetical protein